MEWVAISLNLAMTGFLLLAVLGAMREIVLLRGSVAVVRDLIQNPPPPSFTNGPAPDRLVRLLQDGATSNGSSPHKVVAFLSPGCQPCEDIATRLSRAVAKGEIRDNDVLVVVWALRREDAEQFASRLSLPHAVDTGALSRACEVRATPTLFLVSRGDWTVIDYTPEGSIEWIQSRMNLPTEVAAL